MDDFSFSSIPDGKYYYGVQIVTGKQMDAGTTGDSYVMLVGDKGKTEKLSLRGWFDFRVGKNSLNNLTIVTDDDLGKVLVVVVGCDSGWFEDHWYVSFVTVVNLQLQEVDRFPCNHWIDGDSHVTITATTSELLVVPQGVYI